jgi:quercetin dioxygenase-like cupin family protein
MNPTTNRGTWLKRTAGAGVLAAAGLLYAQPSGLTRTVLTRADVSVPGREAVVARVEVAPGGRAGRHVHPGDEIRYVLEGEADIIMHAQLPQILKPGD